MVVATLCTCLYYAEQQQLAFSDDFPSLCSKSAQASVLAFLPMRNQDILSGYYAKFSSCTPALIFYLSSQVKVFFYKYILEICNVGPWTRFQCLVRYHQK